MIQRCCSVSMCGCGDFQNKVFWSLEYMSVNQEDGSQRLGRTKPVGITTEEQRLAVSGPGSDRSSTISNPKIVRTHIKVQAESTEVEEQ
ncbi:hypothetical protein ScPMuIL_003981 [Solemya velum]